MGFLRFFKRVTIAPGITLNFSKHGISFSIGGRGAKFTFGTSGTRTTVGLPGSGIYYTSHAPWRRQQTQDNRIGHSTQNVTSRSPNDLQFLEQHFQKARKTTIKKGQFSVRWADPIRGVVEVANLQSNRDLDSFIADWQYIVNWQVIQSGEIVVPQLPPQAKILLTIPCKRIQTCSTDRAIIHFYLRSEDECE